MTPLLAARGKHFAATLGLHAHAKSVRFGAPSFARLICTLWQSNPPRVFLLGFLLLNFVQFDSIHFRAVFVANLNFCVPSVLFLCELCVKRFASQRASPGAVPVHVTAPDSFTLPAHSKCHHGFWGSLRRAALPPIRQHPELFSVLGANAKGQENPSRGGTRKSWYTFL